MKKRYKLKKKPCIIIIFIVNMLFLFTFNVTSSRYLEQLEGGAEDIIAIPVMSLDNPTFNYQPNDMLPGYVDEADFFVNNFDEVNQNEVLMKYYLNIHIDSVIPVKVTLTGEDGTEIVLTENKTGEYELPYTEKMITRYHIKIEWDEQYNDYTYAGKEIKLTIDLYASQVV